MSYILAKNIPSDELSEDTVIFELEKIGETENLMKYKHNPEILKHFARFDQSWKPVYIDKKSPLAKYKRIQCMLRGHD